MKACVYVSVCDKIVQDTEPYRKENLPMIRYGTIGTNFIVDRFQEAAMENPGLHYSAVYSRNQETAGNFAAKYGVETTYTDLNAFACADDLDAVYIASPNRLHYGQAALLLSHGKHVLQYHACCAGHSRFSISEGKGIDIVDQRICGIHRTALCHDIDRVKYLKGGNGRHHRCEQDGR